MKNVMVCVTQQKTCARLIEYGNAILKEDDGELFIIHVAPSDFKILGNAQEGKALDYLYEKALKFGATLTVIRSSNVMETIAELVKKHKVSHLVLGASGKLSSEDNFIARLTDIVGNKAQIVTVPSDNTILEGVS